MGLTNRLFQEKGNLSLKENEVGTNLINHDYHLTKASRVIALGKLTSTEIYSILILKVQSKPSSNIYFKNLFNYDDIDRTAIHTLPRLVTHNTYVRSFQYKILK